MDGRRKLRLALGARPRAKRAPALRALRCLGDAQRGGRRDGQHQNDDSAEHERNCTLTPNLQLPTPKRDSERPGRSLWELGVGSWALKVSQPADKPNSVPPRLRASRRADGDGSNDHSSRPVIAHGLERPTRWLRTGRPVTPPYLVLLRAGFCLPPTLPPARCALTAPFHPYPASRALRRYGGAVFFLCHWSVKLPCPGVTRRTALRSSDFPPAFALRASARQARRQPGCEDRRSSGRLRRSDYPRPTTNLQRRNLQSRTEPEHELGS